MSNTCHAILIGNSHYPNAPDLPDLNCPGQDVDDLQALLTSSNYGLFAPENITVLKNKTSNEITQALYQGIQDADKDDLILIYYSGHGKLDLTGHLHLTTIDTDTLKLDITSLATHRIRQWLRTYPRNRVVIILDCCFAGNIKQDWITRSDEDALLSENLGGWGIYILAATSANTTAKEKTGDRNGLFTKYLLQGIESGEADSNRSGFITTGAIFDYVNRQIQSEGLQQPKKWSFDVSGEEINIAKSGREPRQERAERLRRKLLELASENPDFDDIFAEARLFIYAPETELNEIQQQRDALLEQLDNEQISSLRFYHEWHLLDAPKPPEPRAIPKSEPLPDPQPVTVKKYTIV